jgi:hypothetical protein
MALSSRQITLVTSTATPLLVQGSGSGTTFKNISGTTVDPLPVSLKNEDASVVIWIGGPDVSATAGQSLAPGQAAVLNLYGNPVDIPYAYAVGTPKISVMVGRQ